MKTKLFTLCVAIIVATALFAYDCKVDGIYYNLNSTDLTAEVTSETGGPQAKSYSGSVVIPSSITYESKIYSVTTIGDFAFSDCLGLTSVTIPNSVTTIGRSVFSKCTGLTSITIPNSVTTIGNYAFEYCSGLTSVTIGNSVITIGNYAFEYCSGLTSVTIGNSVITIGGFAFAYCSSLTSITIPNSVTTIGSQAFDGCSNIKSVTWNAKNCNGSYYDSYYNWQKPFFGSQVETFIFGDSVEVIPFYICHEMHQLTNITIPNSVTSIGNSAFEDCFGLTSITIPNSVTSIGNSAFKGVNNIVYNGIATGSPWGAKCINGYVDGYLVYNDASKTILYGCSSAASGKITIPNSVTTIGDSAFYICYGLTLVTIGNSVTTIGNDAFYYCSSLTSITFPNSVTTIGSQAFDGCFSLTSLTIPNSVTTIGNDAFNSCSGLTSVTIPNSISIIGTRVFSYCYGLTSITIPNSVKTIGKDAFYKCSSLSYIDFGCGLKEIGNGAFASCNIDTAVIYSTTPPACTSTTFDGLSRYAYLLVPQNCERAYKFADGWEEFDIHVMEANVAPSVVDVTVIPLDNAVQVTWPISDNAVNYSIVITKASEEICTLNFNAQGQLVNIAFAAPGRDGSRQAPAATLTSQGYQFTVTGLNPGTAYNYSVVATDAEGKTIAEHKGNFSTTGGTGIDNINWTQGTKHQTLKYLHNGQLLINRNGQHYSAMGERIR